MVDIAAQLSVQLSMAKDSTGDARRSGHLEGTLSQRYAFCEEYASKLRALAERIDFPVEYIASITDLQN